MKPMHSPKLFTTLLKHSPKASVMPQITKNGSTKAKITKKISIKKTKIITRGILIVINKMRRIKATIQQHTPHS